MCLCQILSCQWFHKRKLPNRSNLRASQWACLFMSGRKIKKLHHATKKEKSANCSFFATVSIQTKRAAGCTFSKVICNGMRDVYKVICLWRYASRDRWIFYAFVLLRPSVSRRGCKQTCRCWIEGRSSVADPINYSCSVRRRFCRCVLSSESWSHRWRQLNPLHNKKYHRLTRSGGGKKAPESLIQHPAGRLSG